MPILLASGSPQRAAILKQLGLQFRVVVPDVEEYTVGAPSSLVLENVRRKINSVDSSTSSDELILACDTIVDVDGISFGKPETAEDAYTMLSLLRGRTHDVVTGIVLSHPSTQVEHERVVRTKVRFRNFSDSLLERYIEGKEWQGRAGGYAIQGTGAMMVSGIGGDYLNVVGLPVAVLMGILEETDNWYVLAQGNSPITNQK